MIFSSIRNYNFRNLKDDEVFLEAKDIYLVGENGQGKSNFLEAIYFSNYASSFRGSKDADVISFNNKQCSVQSKLCNNINESILIKIENNKKSIILDGKKIENRKDLLSVFSCIIFCHEDMEFITGSPEKRRWFFDQNISLYNIDYLDNLISYKKILKTRNVLLKEIKNGGKKNILDIIDPQLIEYGIKIIQEREKETNFFSGIFEKIYKDVSNIDNINICYKSMWKDKTTEELTEKLIANREKDILFGVTLSGPHRDKYIFCNESDNFSDNASTGQKRLFALLLRVAQALRYTEMTHKKPVLLLDDVLLELDGEKRSRFLKSLPEYEQAFYTFLPEEPYQKYKRNDTLVYFVQDGTLKL